MGWPRKFSEPEKHTIYSAFVIAIGIAFYWWMFFEVGHLSGRNQERAQMEAEHYAAEAAENMERTCSKATGSALRECIRNVVDSERESSREESDLAAQWSAVDWARWATVVAGAQLLATIIGLYFIKATLDATRKAVEDTTKATEAMERQNEITQEAQRAWIALTAEPKLLRRVGVDGLYFRVNFIAQNIGNTAATHFDIYNEVFFTGQNETGQQVYTRILKQVEEWKSKHWAKTEWVLLPGDSEISPWWDSREADDIKWWTQTGLGAEKVAQPIFAVIVLYKTASKPNTIQCSWRAWYLQTVDERRQTVSVVPMPTPELGPEHLCVEPFRTSLNHEEYPDEGVEERAQPGPAYAIHA